LSFSLPFLSFFLLLNKEENMVHRVLTAMALVPKRRRTDRTLEVNVFSLLTAKFMFEVYIIKD
jgi:hypothetical protein